MSLSFPSLTGDFSGFDSSSIFIWSVLVTQNTRGEKPIEIQRRIISFEMLYLPPFPLSLSIFISFHLFSNIHFPSLST
jgi:hypothetical protein